MFRDSQAQREITVIFKIAFLEAEKKGNAASKVYSGSWSKKPFHSCSRIILSLITFAALLVIFGKSDVKNVNLPGGRLEGGNVRGVTIFPSLHPRSAVVTCPNDELESQIALCGTKMWFVFCKRLLGNFDNDILIVHSANEALRWGFEADFQSVTFF